MCRMLALTCLFAHYTLRLELYEVTYIQYTHTKRERVRWKELGTWGWTVFWHSSTVRKESWKKNNRKETVCLYYALKRSLFSFINLLLAGNLLYRFLIYMLHLFFNYLAIYFNYCLLLVVWQSLKFIIKVLCSSYNTSINLTDSGKFVRLSQWIRHTPPWNPTLQTIRCAVKSLTWKWCIKDSNRPLLHIKSDLEQDFSMVLCTETWFYYGTCSKTLGNIMETCPKTVSPLCHVKNVAMVACSDKCSKIMPSFLKQIFKKHGFTLVPFTKNMELPW